MIGKQTLRFLTMAVALLFVISIGGTWATWYYARGNCADVYVNLPLDIFPWQGSDILPEEDQVEVAFHIGAIMDKVQR